MTLQERRHDRLAVRLSLIISRLVSGETLFIRKLATEFGVSERTLRRDFRERLMYLDLDYYQGQCSLRSDIHSTRQEIDILTFAHRTGLAGQTSSPGRKALLLQAGQSYFGMSAHHRSDRRGAS